MFSKLIIKLSTVELKFSSLSSRQTSVCSVANVAGNKWQSGYLWELDIPPGPVTAGFVLRFASDNLGWIRALLRGEGTVATGTVKWFNAAKGYGFIQPDGGGKDVFVHISAVEKAGFTGLAEGAKISYEVVNDRGK